MTIQLALEYIPKRLKELACADYHLRMRHFVLQPNEKIEISSYNQLYLLVEEVNDIRITSDTGLFDLSESNTNELLYEHEGKIVIENYAPYINRVRFIQIILK